MRQGGQLFDYRHLAWWPLEQAKSRLFVQPIHSSTEVAPSQVVSNSPINPPVSAAVNWRPLSTGCSGPDKARLSLPCQHVGPGMGPGRSWQLPPRRVFTGTACSGQPSVQTIPCQNKRFPFMAAFLALPLETKRVPSKLENTPRKQVQGAQ